MLTRNLVEMHQTKRLLSYMVYFNNHFDEFLKIMYGMYGYYISLD